MLVFCSTELAGTTETSALGGCPEDKKFERFYRPIPIMAMHSIAIFTHVYPDHSIRKEVTCTVPGKGLDPSLLVLYMHKRYIQKYLPNTKLVCGMDVPSAVIFWIPGVVFCREWLQCCYRLSRHLIEEHKQLPIFLSLFCCYRLQLTHTKHAD